MSLMNRQPIFVHHPVTTQTAIPNTANTNRDGTGTITQIYAADATVGGSLVEVIRFIAQGTTTAGIINLFRKAAGAGNWMFIGQVDIAAATPSATVKAADAFYAGADMPLRLAANDTLGAAPTKAEAFNSIVQGGPLTNSDV